MESWIAPNGLLGKSTVDTERTLALARLSERKGNLPTAEKIYRNMQEKNEADPALSHRLGVVAARQGRLEEARVHFATSLEAGGESAELLADMGYCCYLLDDLPAAEESLRAALELDPHDVRARNNLGLVIGEQGRFDESFAQFKLAGEESKAHANLAYVYSQVGQLQLATEEYNLALSLDQTLRPAANAMVELARDGKTRETVRNYAHNRSPAMPNIPEPSAVAPISLAANQHSPEETDQAAALPTKSAASTAGPAPVHHQQTPVPFAPSVPSVVPATFVAPVSASRKAAAANADAATSLWYDVKQTNEKRTTDPATPGNSLPTSQPARLAPIIPLPPQGFGPTPTSTRGTASLSDEPSTPGQAFAWPEIK